MTLPVSKLISVAATLTAAAAQGINFGNFMIFGDSNVIDVSLRSRLYSSLAAIATDFGTSAAEYLAAKDFFAQTPQPPTVAIARWAKTATAGLNIGGALTATQQGLGNWTTITNGGFHVAVDGGASTNITGLNFSAQTTLAGVASVIQTGLQAIGGAFASVTCTWNATYGYFQIVSGTTGATSAVTALTAPTAGTDISGQLMMTAATLQRLVAGIAAESALTAVTILDGMTTPFYGFSFAAGTNNTDISTSDYLAIAAYTEADTVPHLFGITVFNVAAALLAGDSTSVGAQLKALGYNRTGYIWNGTDPYAVCSLLAKLITVNYLASGSTITLAWKQLPGVAADNLTTSQAAALDANNYSYYAQVANGTSIVYNGTVASGHYWDEIINTDWLANYIQTNVYNVLFTTTTKIPQTDAGMHQIGTAIEGSCSQAVSNGFLAPGVWTGPGFGQISTGTYLSKGFYLYQPPIANQSQAARAARQSVPFQIAAKEAGAVHSVSISLTVNQ
jgi:hypothetical protein